MSQPAIAASLSRQQQASQSRVRSGFFFWTSTLLLVFVLVGFAPTLFLRALFAPEPIPGYLYAHGAVLTAWFTWFVVQTSMVKAGRTATHRRLGVIGAAIGAAVCVAGPMATFGVVGRLRAAGLDWDTDMSVIPALGVEGVPMIRFAAQVVWANLASVVVFALLFVAAIVMRRDSQWHKRLMLLGSIAIIGPALARISRWPVFGGEDGPFIPSLLLALLVAVVVHDIVATRRLHRATLVGCAAILLATIAQQFIAGSEFGLAVVRMMG